MPELKHGKSEVVFELEKLAREHNAVAAFLGERGFTGTMTFKFRITANFFPGNYAGIPENCYPDETDITGIHYDDVDFALEHPEGKVADGDDYLALRFSIDMAEAEELACNNIKWDD